LGIKAYIEMLVDFFMNCMVLVADFSGGLVFLPGFGFGRRTVLIGTTNVQGFVISGSAEPGKSIRGEDTTDDIAEMGFIVDVRQSRSNQTFLIFAVVGRHDG
jgi:hypothetical protein